MVMKLCSCLAIIGTIAPNSFCFISVTVLYSCSRLWRHMWWRHVHSIPVAVWRLRRLPWWGGGDRMPKRYVVRNTVTLSNCYNGWNRCMAGSYIIWLDNLFVARYQWLKHGSCCLMPSLVETLRCSKCKVPSPIFGQKSKTVIVTHYLAITVHKWVAK